MTLTAEKRPMAKMGRPPREGKLPTRMIRASEDIADMIAWVCRAEGLEASELLDILLRSPLTLRYGSNQETIQDLWNKREASARETGKEPPDPLPPFPPMAERLSPPKKGKK